MPRVTRSSSDLSDIAARLKAARKEKELSTAEAAEIAGVSSPAWSNYEAGIRMPDIVAMRHFCSATDMTLDWIYLGRTGGLPESFGKKMSLRFGTVRRHTA